MTISESNQKLLDRTCKYLRSTLLSQKFGVAADQLTRDYMDMVGEQIPYQQLNFPSLESFLISIPNVCRITGTGSDLYVVGVASKATSHIEDMVRKQNSKGGKKRGNVGKQKGSFYSNNVKPKPLINRGCSNGAVKEWNNNNGNKYNNGGSGVYHIKSHSVWDNSRGSFVDLTATALNGGKSNGSTYDWGNRSNGCSQNTVSGNNLVTSNYNGYPSNGNSGKYPISSHHSKNNGNPNSSKFNGQQNGWVGKMSIGDKSLHKKIGFNSSGGNSSSNNGWTGNSTISNISCNLKNGHKTSSRNKQNGYNTVDGSKHHLRNESNVNTVRRNIIQVSGSNVQTQMLFFSIGQVQQLLRGRQHGLFVSQVENMYKRQFGENLTSDWVKQMGGLLSVDSSQVCKLVQSEKAKVSVSGFCPDYSLSQVYGQKAIISQPSFPQDSTWDIFVCCVPQINKIYFHLNKFQSQFQDLYTEMTTYYTTTDCKPVSTPKVGGFYCARFGGEFCRVQMLDSSQVDFCLCLLVDLGVLESVMFTDLLDLVPAFQMLPIQAMTGRLSGINFMSDPAKIQLVSKTLEGRSFTATVINLSELGEGPGGNDIDPSLVLMDGKEEVTAKLIDSLSRNEEHDKLSNILSRLTLSPYTLPFTMLPSVGDYYDVTVSLVYTPDRFIIQPYSDRKKYQDLVMDMNQFYSCVQIPVVIAEIKEGELFAVKQNCSWARAKLEKILTADHLALRMRLVDSGYMVLHSLADLQPLRSEFCSLPAQAIVASLGGIQPSVKDRWDNSLVNWFKGVVVGNSFVGLVEEMKMEEGEKVLGLQLFDTSDREKDVNINEEIMKMDQIRK